MHYILFPFISLHLFHIELPTAEEIYFYLFIHYFGMISLYFIYFARCYWVRSGIFQMGKKFFVLDAISAAISRCANAIAVIYIGHFRLHLLLYLFIYLGAIMTRLYFAACHLPHIILPSSFDSREDIIKYSI